MIFLDLCKIKASVFKKRPRLKLKQKLPGHFLTTFQKKMRKKCKEKEKLRESQTKKKVR